MTDEKQSREMRLLLVLPIADDRGQDAPSQFMTQIDWSYGLITVNSTNLFKQFELIQLDC
jgi:hypothetical protein